MKNKKRALLILLTSFFLIFSILFTQAWGWWGKKNKDRKTFVMVPKGVHPYYEPCFDGFKDAAKKYGVKAEMETPLKFELALQVKVIEDLIARGVDGIAISALDDNGLISVVNEAVNAGIKVITFDAPAPSTKALTYIGTDNEQAGYAGGEAFAELMGKEGELVILQGGLGATNLNLRTKGFKAAIAKVAPNIKIVSVEDTKGDFAEAVNKTEAILEAYPNLKGIFGVSAYGAPAASTVIKEQKKAGKILIGGFDDLKDTLNGIKDGSIQMCLVQRTYNMGWLSIEKLLDAIDNKSIPEVIDTGVLIVNKSNVNSYMAEMKKEFK